MLYLLLHKKKILKSIFYFYLKQLILHLAQIRSQTEVTPSQNIPHMLLRNISLLDNTFTLVQTWIVPNTFSSLRFTFILSVQQCTVHTLHPTTQTQRLKFKTWYKVWSNAPDKCTAENEKQELVQKILRVHFIKAQTSPLKFVCVTISFTSTLPLRNIWFLID